MWKSRLYDGKIKALILKMRTILHSDLNNFYASVECLRNPEIRDKPVVVVGSKEDRHGIVLAKNLIAKRAGVATGDVWWEAQRSWWRSKRILPHI